MTEDNVSFCGFMSFIKQKCISGSYANTIYTQCSNCLKWCYIFAIIILFLLGASISLGVVIYGSIILFLTIGRIESSMDICSLIVCITAEHYNEQSTDPLIVHFFSVREKNQCCSCNTTSETYNNYDTMIGITTNTCEADGYIDYVLTGMMGSFFVPILIATLCLSWYIIFVPLRAIYTCTKMQWEEYLGKKIDSQVKSMGQYTRLNIKDSNIIYQDDIELGYQTNKVINEECVESESLLSDTNSTKSSEDGILIDISDTDGYRK